MKVLIVGATGTIGSAVCGLLGTRHEILRIGHVSGDFRVDMASRESIEQLFRHTGSFDALVCAAGQARFGGLGELSDEDIAASVAHKLLGQINLVRIGLDYVHPDGSFTLTSGVAAREPMPGTAAIAMVNGGIESFVRAAALEMPAQVRINAVSPVYVRESMVMRGMGSLGGMPAADTARAYAEAVEGRHQGEVLDVRLYGENTGSVVI